MAAGDTPAPPDSGSDVPASCADVANCADAWVSFEDEVLRLTNAQRVAGATCGAQSFPPAAALTMSPALRCAARRQSRDMALQGFFSHTSPDGTGPGERITAAGYSAWTWGENIAGGQRTPTEVVAGWIKSPGHCSNMMSASFTEIGVGYYYDSAAAYSHYWTQTFAAPR